MLILKKITKIVATECQMGSLQLVPRLRFARGVESHALILP